MITASVHWMRLIHEPVNVSLLECPGSLVSDGMIGNLVAFRVKLFRQPIIVPFMSNVEGTTNRAAIRIGAIRKQLFVKPETEEKIYYGKKPRC